MNELPETVYAEIVRLCAAGDELARMREHQAALAEYNKAWMLVPEPKSDWETSTWILAAITDTCFFGGFYISAREALEYAMHCPGTIGNPFLHLRLGQILFEAGESDAAADELIRAYMGAGSEIFESQGPKYSAFLRTRAKL